MNDANNNIASPCVRHCCLDEQDICLGCFRSLDEIVRWNEAGNQQRRDILRNTRQRRNAHALKYGGYPGKA